LYNILYDTGIKLFKENRLDEALKIFQELLEKNSKDHTLYRNIAVIYHNKKSYQKALEFYQKSLKLSPDPETYFQLGKLFEAVKNYKLATIAYQKAIELNSKNIGPINNLGV
jgi:tetratricopeptide (TPR) repeat protein